MSGANTVNGVESMVSTPLLSMSISTDALQDL
jgi:hypothetical protein